MRARKRFGQHFLTDEAVLQSLVAAVGVRAADALLEIGPGLGALTEHMASLPARYVAIELDRDLVPLLRARYPAIELFSEDILRAPLAERLAGSVGWRVVGNLPYNISSPLILRLAGFVRSQQDVVADCHFMLQREMAARLSAQPGSKAWGRLSVMAQLTFAIDPLFDVGPESFSPPPKVHSTVVRFTPKENLRLEVDLEVFDRVLRMAFAARRKRLSNALRSFALDWASAPVEPHMRADAISLDEYVQLARLVAQTHNTDA